MLEGIKLDLRYLTDVTILSARQFRDEIGSCRITEITRTIVQRGAVKGDGAEVEREPGLDNDLITSTFAVTCTETKGTMVRRASRGEERRENALKYLDKTTEACQVGRRIPVRVENKEAFEGWNLLVPWAQSGFEHLMEPVRDEWPRIWNLTQERTCMTVDPIIDDEWKQFQDMAYAYAEESIANYQEMIRGRDGIPIPSRQ
jgi:hypothetical protein